MFFFYYNRLFRLFFPKMTWRKDTTKKKVIYLTFDDGPIPDVTEWVLKELEKYKATATFFCVGDNINKHPAIYQLVKEKHKTANHTFNHLKGWETSLNTYVNNVVECEQYLGLECGEEKLFRPPHGRLTISQANQLRAMDYEIIMWEVLSADFSPKVSKEKCLKKSIQHTKNGSIIVFHDSIKTIEKLKFVLPRYLKHFSDLGYSFESL